MSDSFENSFSKINAFKAKIIVEEYPSIKEVEYLINSCLRESNYPLDYDINQNNEKLEIILPNENIALFVLGKCNEKKSRNIYFLNTTFSMQLIPNKDIIKRFIIKKPKVKLTDEITERLYRGASPYPIKNRIRKNRYKNSLIASEEYKSMWEKEIMNRNKDKKKWISPTNFNLYFHTNNDKVYGRDFAVHKPGNPLGYNFRSIDRAKWVSPTNFKV